ncbi:(d)CMP kinase [Coxiella endosymbiont of Amblyomma nuttalli]|uniref:(d)CMP kinase n=1 Tax=Coxiella endosymbiont of Amblyomma nuttalli TaxID=2749996 RepID=UPI001BB7B345|nr:(d)CMP kinase [Coxiella endosymbiont of Amblyomma nuttalli]QTS83872.1 Cytidylate kinase [Coxiella endosymbiont of Amblyomma nuttalli]
MMRGFTKEKYYHEIATHLTNLSVGSNFISGKQEVFAESSEKQAPVITVDGLSGSGKGTIAWMVAQALGWYVLDSGIIYRVIAWALLYYNVSLSNVEAVAFLLKRVQVMIASYQPNKQPKVRLKVSCDGHDITQAIRSKECGIMASRASTLPLVRSAMLQYQRNFRRQPGLVADGRDMGTVVFPDASLKFFFNADLAVRAYRRCKQLQDQGINVRLRDIQEDLEERDRRDISRSIAPTKPANHAVVIDVTNLSLDEVFALVMRCVKQQLLDKGALL